MDLRSPYFMNCNSSPSLFYSDLSKQDDSRRKGKKRRRDNDDDDGPGDEMEAFEKAPRSYGWVGFLGQDCHRHRNLVDFVVLGS